MSYNKILLITISIFLGSCSSKNSDGEINNNNYEEEEMNSIKKQEVLQVSQNKFELEFGIDLKTLKVGEKFDLVFRPLLKEKMDAPIILETIHERKVHLIFVSEDLEFFNHIHPGKETNGLYSVETSLPYGGKYILFAEYKPVREANITETISLRVSGERKPKKIYNSEKNIYQSRDYSVKLLNTNNLIVGNDSRIIVKFYKNEEEIDISQLENYLGEKAHAVAISLRDKNFMHIHPMVMDNRLNLHLNFDKSDLYRLWIQFKINGQVHTADFAVKANLPEKIETITNQHTHH